MNIYGYTVKMLESYFESKNENIAKAKIVFKALYRDKIKSFDQISALSKPVTDMLSNDFEIGHAKVIDKSENNDTCKLLFELQDQSAIETVIMKHDYGNGVCISTQVGCNMDCAFCESGKLKKVRNLETFEMVQQVLYVTDVLEIPVSHVVLMGIGEPFDNYDKVIGFTDIITDQLGLGIAARHVTISTSGIVPKIIEFSKREVVNSLAVSLHAPDNELRNKLMPINKKYPIEQLVDAVRIYVENGNKKATFAYIMIKDVNDSDECAQKLANLIKGIKCYVNLIPYNETSNSAFRKSDKERISSFFDILKKNGVNVTVRREFGGELKAACGQLSAEHRKKINFKR